MLSTSFLVAALSLQGVVAKPLHNYLPKRDTSSRFTVRDTKAFADATPLEVASEILTLKSATTNAQSSSALQHSLRASIARTPLISADDGSGYAIDITFGGKTFEVILDTGSSDLWLAEQSVKCVDINMEPQPVSACAFGPLASNTFQDGAIKNENFNISYGDGEFLTGTVGYEDVGIAGITVKKQEVALVNYAYWEGDNVTSGLVGFAYPSLTSAFSGTNPAVDNPNTNEIPYNPWIFSAITQGLVAPMFSLAIERGANGGGGQLALGGLPSISFNHTFTSTPLQIVDLIDVASAAKNYSFYTIDPQGFVLSGDNGFRSIKESPSTNFPVIVDSGTTLVYLPTQLAEEVNAAFDPPSVYIEEEGVYENYCDAIPPSFAVRINGTDFYISGQDLLLTGEGGYDPETGGCLTGIQPMDGVYILGDVFLKNVVAVFDIGASEMRFAPHEDY